MNDSKFKRTVKNLKENMRNMSFKERIAYLWFCFKEYTIVGVVCLILVGALIFSVINVNTEILIYGDLISVPISSEGLEYLTDDYGKLLEVEENKREIEIAQLDFGIADDADIVEFNYQTTMQIVAAASAKTLDFIMTSQPVMENFIQHYMYMDLREIMTEEELLSWGENIVYVEYVFSEGTPEEKTERIPVALNLQNTEFYKNCIYSRNPYFLMFIKISPRKEACRHFLDYLLAYEPPKEAVSGG